MGVLLLVVILVPRAGMGLDAVRAGASTTETSTESSSSDARTATPTPNMEIPSVTATPTDTTAPQHAALTPVVSATPTAVATNAPATTLPKTGHTETPQPEPEVTETPTSTPTTPLGASRCEDDASCAAAGDEPGCTGVPAPNTTQLQRALLDRALKESVDHVTRTRCDDPSLLHTEVFEPALSEFVTTSSPDFPMEEIKGNKLQISVLQQKNDSSYKGRINFNFTFLCRDQARWVLSEISAALSYLNSSDDSTLGADIVLNISTEKPTKPEETSCPNFSRQVTIEKTGVDFKFREVSNQTFKETLGNNSIETTFGRLSRHWNPTPNGKIDEMSSILSEAKSAQTKLNSPKQCDGAIFSSLFGLNEQLSKFWQNLSTLELNAIRWPLVESSILSQMTKHKSIETAPEEMKVFLIKTEMRRDGRSIGTPADESNNRTCTSNYESKSHAYNVSEDEPENRESRSRQFFQDSNSSTFKAADLKPVQPRNTALLSLDMDRIGQNPRGRKVRKRLRASLESQEDNQSEIDEQLTTEFNRSTGFCEGPDITLPDAEKRMLLAYLAVRTKLEQDDFFSNTTCNPYDDLWLGDMNGDDPVPPADAVE